MHKSENIDYTQLRKRVSRLFIGVLTKRISVQEALSKFPKDCEDKTIIASWHALCHLEADEDIRRKDIEYKREQDEYIEFIMFTLQKGEDLPKNIINSYIPYHKESLIPSSNNVKGILKTIKRFLCC